MGHDRPGGGRGSPQGREAGLDPRRQRSPWQGPSLADVENLGLRRCCFASALSLQLRLDSPKRPELPYLAALGDGFCHGPLAPSFSLERSEGKRVEKRFRCVVRGAAFMGLVQGVRVQAEAPSACGLWRRGALLGLLGAAHTPRPRQGRKKMPLLLTGRRDAQSPLFCMGSALGSLSVAPHNHVPPPPVCLGSQRGDRAGTTYKLPAGKASCTCAV